MKYSQNVANICLFNLYTNMVKFHILFFITVMEFCGPGSGFCQFISKKVTFLQYSHCFRAHQNESDVSCLKDWIQKQHQDFQFVCVLSICGTCCQKGRFSESSFLYPKLRTHVPVSLSPQDLGHDFSCFHFSFYLHSITTTRCPIAWILWVRFCLQNWHPVTRMNVQNLSQNSWIFLNAFWLPLYNF